MLKKPHPGGTLKVEEAMKAQEKNGPLPTAPENSVQRNAVKKTHQPVIEKDSEQNMSPVKSPVVESIYVVRCIVYDGTATVSVTTPGSRQDTCRNNSLRVTSSVRAMEVRKSGNEENAENSESPRSICASIVENVQAKSIQHLSQSLLQ